MKTRTKIPTILAFLMGLVIAPLAVAGGSSVRLGFKGPPNLGQHGLLVSDDWALILELQVTDAIGFVDEDLRREDSNKAMVISDPDLCVDMRDWVDLGNPGSSYEMGCLGQNEVFTKFNPDPVDRPGLRDQGGSVGGPTIDDALRAALIDDPFSAADIANLNRQYWTNNVSSGAPGTAGPITDGFDSSTSTVPQDGYGYGVNDDMPSLFVWAEIGTGIVTDLNFNPILNSAGGIKLRNMAGLFGGVYYTLLTRNSKSSLTTVLAVDRGMLEPIIQLDFNTDPSTGEASGSYLRRLDGGPIETIPFSDPNATYIDTDPFEDAYLALESYEVTIFAVMVNGQADAFVEDLDGNGRINARDFQAAGHTLLTNITRYKLKAIAIEAIESGAFECPDERVFKVVDLDASGAVASFCSTGNARSLVRRPQ